MRKKLVNYTAKQMYDLVNDVQSYPKFIPWCSATRVISRTDAKLCASLNIAKGAFRRSFTTCNILHPYHRMDISLVDGPFKRLAGFWSFEEYANGKCMISFELEFEFSNAVLSAMFRPVFYSMALGLVECFTRRAGEIYP